MIQVVLTTFMLETWHKNDGFKKSYEFAYCVLAKGTYYNSSILMWKLAKIGICSKAEQSTCNDRLV